MTIITSTTQDLRSIAAMKGKLGNTDYYVIIIKSADLVRITEIPSEMSKWKDMKLEEREQRDIDFKRIKEKIAPYLANHKDRFFGSIILTAKTLTFESFEPLNEIIPAARVPNLYEHPAQSLGFLTLNNQEKLIPLDGQHRLKAIEFAITGKDNDGNKISGMKACSELANEDVTVILINHDTQKARKIFTRVNSYAKSTGKGQNLVIDDEDFVAVSARRIANNQEIIGPSLVKYKNNSNTLSDNEIYFTTLATIANCNKAIIEGCFQQVGSPPLVIDDAKQEMYMSKINEVWKHLTENIKEFSVMLADKTPNGDKKRITIRTKFLLGKPVPQLCLFKAFIRLINSNRYTSNEASALLNKINWSKDAKLWDRLLMSGSKIISTNRNIAARIIYYVAGGSMDMDKKAKESLLKDYQNLFPPKEQDKIVLPKTVG